MLRKVSIADHPQNYNDSVKFAWLRAENLNPRIVSNAEACP